MVFLPIARSGEKRTLLVLLSIILAIEPAMSGEKDAVLPNVFDNAAAERWPAGKVPVGAGFAVSSGGRILTAAHVVAGCKKIEVQAPGGEVKPALLIGVDSRIDLALLSAPGVKAAIGSIVMPESIDDASFTVVGFGQPHHAAAEPVAVVVKGNGTTDELASGPLFRLEGRLEPGTSGSAVISDRGHVVGMVIGRFGTDGSHIAAVEAADIVRFLAYFGIIQEPPPMAVVALDAALLVQCR